MFYLDTSALLKLYIREDGSEAVQDYLNRQHDPLPISDILEMELTNALQLKVFWGDIEQADADAQAALFAQRKKRGLYYHPEVYRSELMAAFRTFSGQTSKWGCRTMDILHVAYAKIYEVDEFVTLDQRQRALAESVGLRVPALT